MVEMECSEGSVPPGELHVRIGRRGLKRVRDTAGWFMLDKVDSTPEGGTVVLRGGSGRGGLRKAEAVRLSLELVGA